jgi:hypothetical protein
MLAAGELGRGDRLHGINQPQNGGFLLHQEVCGDLTRASCSTAKPPRSSPDWQVAAATSHANQLTLFRAVPK